MLRRLLSYLKRLFYTVPDPLICPNTFKWIQQNISSAVVVSHISSPLTPVYPSFAEISGREVILAKDQVVLSGNNRYLAVIENASIHTPSGYIQLPTGEILIETAWTKENIIGNKKYFAQVGQQVDRPGKWFSVILYWSENYYHWFCDVLPRLYKVIELLPPDVNFIVPVNLEHWKIKSLEAVGVPASRCWLFDGKTSWKLEKLFYTPPVMMTGDIESESIRWVQSRLSCFDQAVTDKGIEKIYISRRRALKRRVINEDELGAFLEKLDFKILVAEDYSFEEQVNIFRNASHVVAPHGAGLTNLLHCRPGTRVLEIFDPFSVRRCYRSLASSLDLHYACYLGKHIDIGLKGEGDIYIDMNHFKTNFTNWLDKSLSTSS